MDSKYYPNKFFTYGNGKNVDILMEADMKILKGLLLPFQITGVKKVLMIDRLISDRMLAHIEKPSLSQ